MDRVILNQNQHWKKMYPELIKRNILGKLIEQLSLKEIQVIVGIRRSGKSTLFKLLINYLMQTVNPREILYINLDDPFFSEIYKAPEKLYQVIETAEKLAQTGIKYLFLDEIQHVSSWEKFVKSIYDAELYQKIFITGSNSYLLKGDYASLLSGRYILDEVYPFSFRELLNYHEIKDRIQLIEEKAKILKIVDDLMEYGAYPEIIKCRKKELKREILINYFDTVILKDCIGTGRIRDVKTFNDLTYYIITNAATLFSYNQLARNLNSNENSIKDYIHLLQNSFIIQELKNFSYSLKKQTKSRKKAYCIDNGFLANVSFRFSSNKGKLFENLVYTELLKRKYQIYFYHEKLECDFIIQDRITKQIKAIQVCYELTDTNRKRELNGLANAGNKLKIAEKIIITYNHEKLINDIQIIPFWKFFSGL